MNSTQDTITIDSLTNQPHINHLNNIDISKLTIKTLINITNQNKLSLSQENLKTKILNDISNAILQHLPDLISNVTEDIKTNLIETNADTTYSLNIVLITPRILNKIIDYKIQNP